MGEKAVSSNYHSFFRKVVGINKRLSTLVFEPLIVMAGYI